MEYPAVPTYSYECVGCGHVVDVFHAMSAEPKVKCETCGKKCRKLMGSGAGLIFKGSGFYETDFKDKKGTPPEKAKAEGATEKKSEGSTDKKAAPEKAKGASKKKAANS